MSLEIEQVGLERIDELVSWRMEVLGEVFAPIGDRDAAALQAANRAYYERELARGGHIACLALLDGVPAGCGGVCLQHEMPSPDNPDGRCAYLMNIYTRPGFQRRGVGAGVVTWLVGRARAWGAGKVYLETTSAGRALYGRLGFVDLPDMMVLPGGEGC